MTRLRICLFALVLCESPGYVFAQPEPVSATFRRANEHAARSRWDEALLDYGRLDQQGARSPSLYWNWAQAASARGRKGEACWALLRARELAPTDPGPRRELNRVRGELGLDPSEVSLGLLGELRLVARVVPSKMPETGKPLRRDVFLSFSQLLPPCFAVINSADDAVAIVVQLDRPGAADAVRVFGGTVTTQAEVSAGGNIDIRAINLVHLRNAEITTSVGTGTGNGGNISIDPPSAIVAGPKSLVDFLQSLAIEKIDVTGAKTDVTQTKQIDRPPNVTIDRQTVVVRVEVRAIECSTAQPASPCISVSYVIGPAFTDFPAGMTVEGASQVVVRVFGPLPQIQQLKAADIRATVSLTGVTVGTSTLNPVVTILPSGPPGLRAEADPLPVKIVPLVFP